MKVLFYRYGSICEPDILSCMEEFGLEIEEYNREMTEKNDSPSVSVRKLSEFLTDHPVDFIFSINFFPFVSDVCNIYHIRYLAWTVDSPVMELYYDSISHEWNRIFLFDRAQYEEIAPLNPGNVFHLPLGARIKPKEELFLKTPTDIHAKYAHDIAFVGSLYSEKSPYRTAETMPAHLEGYLDGIMAAQELVYGYNFIEEILPDSVIEEFKLVKPNFYAQPADHTHLTNRKTMAQLYLDNEITARERLHLFQALSKHFPVHMYTGSDLSALPDVIPMGFAKSITEMPLIFHNSRININTTSKGIRTGLPQRIFDILSCGGFVLSNYQAEIPDLFTIGQDLVCYSSLEEMLDLTRYYLEHEKERAEIAESGLLTLKNNYTLEAQLQKLLFTAFEH